MGYTLLFQRLEDSWEPSDSICSYEFAFFALVLSTNGLSGVSRFSEV